MVDYKNTTRKNLITFITNLSEKNTITAHFLLKIQTTIYKIKIFKISPNTTVEQRKFDKNCVRCNTPTGGLVVCKKCTDKQTENKKTTPPQ